MKYHVTRPGSVAMLALAGAAYPGLALAQSQIYTYTEPGNNRMHQYALLNSGLLALYLNDRGDLGAPYRTSGTFKPVGFTDPNADFAPYINNDGSVNTDLQKNGVRNGTYGVLYSQTPTSGTLAEQVRQKREYLTTGGTSVAEGYALTGDNSRLHSGSDWLTAGNFTLNNFSVANVGSNVSATSQLFRQTGAAGQGLMLTQTISIADDTNLVEFSVRFKNTASTSLTGLRYARAIDPNPGGSTAAQTSQTSQSFRTQSSPDAFAINAKAGGRQMALGVLPGDPGALTVGTRLLATNSIFEGDLLRNPDTQLFDDPASRYVTLGTGKSATYFQGGTAVSTTTDFTTDNSFQPDFGSANSGNVGLVLESDIFSLAAGAETSFNFYYFLDPRGSTMNAPEPGVFALLIGGMVGGVSVLRRRRRA